jgi:hypothetical protein
MKIYPLLSFVLVCACTTQPKTDVATAVSGNSIDEEQTRKVLAHHWETFKGNDLEGTMADYTEESFLITPDKTYHGLAEIRANFVTAFGVFPKDSSKLTLSKSIATRDVGYIIWSAATPTMQLVYATDTFIIQNGKIVRQTYAGLADVE